MKGDREKLSKWIVDIEMVLQVTKMSPVYVPTVKEEWIRAPKQKPTATLENPDKPSLQPNKPKGPKPVRKPVSRKSGGKGPRDDNKGDNKKGGLQQQIENPENQPGNVMEDLEDEPLPPGPGPNDPENPPDPKPKPKGADPKPKPKGAGPKPKPKGPKPNEPVPLMPKSTTDTTSEEPITWYKTCVAYDTKCTGPAATPPEGLLNVARKRKAGGEPKTSGGPSVNKRKKTTPAKWMPYTQPRTTYTIGNKITPAWGLTHRGDMDPAENWYVPLYSPPKLTERQEAAQKEAHKKKKKYKRYKPGQLALNKFYILPKETWFYHIYFCH